MIIGKIQLVDNIKREIPDNSTGQVSPRDVRQNMINIIDSVHMFTADHDLNALNFSTPNTRTTRAGQETLSKLHLQGYSSEDNSAFGYSALSDNYDGTKNTAIGSHSMGCNLYGDSNTAIGFNSLAGNVFGSGNVALGNFTLQRSKFGSFNIAIGHGAGYYVGSHDRHKLYIGSHSLEENDTCDNPLGSGLVPLMYGDMQNLKLGVATTGLHNYGALQVSGDISPSQDCQHNLGHSSYRWNDLYLCNSINESVYFSGDYVGFGANPPSGQGLVTVGGHIVPSLHNTYALGHPELRWDGYFNDITVSGTANIQNAVYTNIEDCTYHCRTLYLASSGLCDDMGGWAPPCGYLHDEQIEGGGFVLQSSGVDYRRNYEFIFSAPDTTLTCLEEDTPYSRSSWNSNISIHVASGSHIKTDRTIGRDNLSLLSDNCCYGIFMKKDTDGIREDRTGINEIQLIEIDATGGTFTLTFDGQTTEIPIPYNASAARVKLALETLSNIGDGNVDVFKGSNSWEIRFTGTLGGKNVSQVTCNGAGLTKTEEEERCTTTTYPGVDEIQKIVITADAGEWRLGHSTRQVSSDCSSDTDYNSQLGGYFTDPIPYDISASDLQTKMRDCFTGMAGNVSVSLSTSGKRRTYTITFVSGLEETNVNPWLVDRYSLTLGDEECTGEETNEIINIELDNETGGTFNILTYLSQSDYNNDCPYYKSADIPFDATASEIDTILTATCATEGCGSFNQNHPACVVPEWIAGVNNYVAVIPSAGSWTPERLDIDRGTDGHRIQVTGQPGDWTIEFGNTAHSSSFFNGKNIAPMRIDDSNLTGGVSLSTPEFTVVRTHEPIENAYNKISVQMIGSTKTERDSLRDGVFSYRINFVIQGVWYEYHTRTLSADATISEVIQAMNEKVGHGANANFFIPYISPGLVAGDPVYGDHEGKNKFWDSVGSYQEAVPRWGNDKLCAYNSRLDTDSTFLGTLLGEGEPWLGSTSTHMGWGWDGMLGEGLGGDFYQWQGFTRTFDILTHTGWLHNYNYDEELAPQTLHLFSMSIQVLDYDPTIISKTQAEHMISFIVAAPKDTTRPRKCLKVGDNLISDYGSGYDAEWSSNGSIRYRGNLSWYAQFSHTVDGYAALGDGIVGVQDGWSTDEFIRLASDSAEVSSQSSGPSYNCDTTGKVLSTSWSWFNSNITQGQYIE